MSRRLVATITCDAEGCNAKIERVCEGTEWDQARCHVTYLWDGMFAEAEQKGWGPKLYYGSPVLDYCHKHHDAPYCTWALSGRTYHIGGLTGPICNDIPRHVSDDWEGGPRPPPGRRLCKHCLNVRKRGS